MKTFYIVLLFCIYGITACEKNNDSNQTPDPNPVSGDSFYISKIYLIDSVAGTEDTTESLTYYYDNLKRLSGYNDSLINGGISVPFYIHHFSYAGTDTLPFKLFRIGIEGSSYRDTLTGFYFYDATGNKIRDSSYRITDNGSFGAYTISNILSTYQYLGSNTIIGQLKDSMFFSSNGILSPTRYQWDTATLDGNRNIIQSKKNNNNSSILLSTFTYTDVPNIFRKMPALKTSNSIFPAGPAFFSFFSKFNQLQSTYTFTNASGSTTYVTNYTIRLNANGYVSQIMYPNPTAPGEYYKAIIEYAIL